MTRRARRWWHGVDADASDPTGTPDPWADRSGTAATLTADQRAVLAGLDDQPAQPHLDGVVGDDDHAHDQPGVPHLRGSVPDGPGEHPGNGTGNPPGDPGPGRSYLRNRWDRRTGREGET